MPINLGNTGLDTAYVGNTQLDKIYQGNTEIWSRTVTPPPPADVFYGYNTRGITKYTYNGTTFTTEFLGFIPSFTGVSNRGDSAFTFNNMPYIFADTNAQDRDSIIGPINLTDPTMTPRVGSVTVNVTDPHFAWQDGRFLYIIQGSGSNTALYRYRTNATNNILTGITRRSVRGRLPSGFNNLELAFGAVISGNVYVNDLLDIWGPLNVSSPGTLSRIGTIPSTFSGMNVQTPTTGTNVGSTTYFMDRDNFWRIPDITQPSTIEHVSSHTIGVSAFSTILFSA